MQLSKYFLKQTWAVIIYVIFLIHQKLRRSSDSNNCHNFKVVISINSETLAGTVHVISVTFTGSKVTDTSNIPVGCCLCSQEKRNADFQVDLGENKDVIFVFPQLSSRMSEFYPQSPCSMVLSV